MTRFLEILIAAAIVAALFLVISFVLPSKRHLTEEIETNRKLTIVYDTLNSFRRFKDWNALPLHDPKVDIKLSGPVSGVGATMNYSSSVPQVGNGTWKITKSDPGKSIEYAIENNRRGSDKRMEFTFEPAGRGAVKRNVKIRQDFHVNYGFDLLGRYAGLYLARHVGDDMQLGLQRLATMLASVPNVDYSAMSSTGMGPIKMVERPAENLLVVSAGSVDKKPDTLKASMKQQMEWINRTMAGNGLTAVGPMRIVSSEVGTDTYTFDVVQPVARGTDATSPMSGLSMQGPVKYVRVEPTRAATASFKGYQGNLENVRNALRAWSLTNAMEAYDRPYEIYTGGIEAAFTDEGQFEVFWNLK